MTTLVFVTSPFQTFETGDLVCFDLASGNAVAYDSNLPIVGVAFVPSSGYSSNGRQWFAINGCPYYENDQYIWQEDLTSDFTQENPLYTPFNPFDSGYVVTITNGIAAVKNTATGLPSSWVLLKEGIDFDWYLVK